MSDYHVKITVKNGRILRLMRAAGFESVAAMCRVSGLRQTQAGRIINMKDQITLDNGDWTDGVYRMAAALRCDPEDMFTEAQISMKLATNTAEVLMDEAGVMALTSGDMEAQQWAKIETQRLLSVLTPRERAIIESTILEGGVFEGADPNGGTAQRAREIQHKALGKMRGAAGRIDREGADKLYGKAEA
jgi:hypothetical protein